MSDTNQSSLYKKLLKAGCTLDNYYSDLYVLATEAARKIIDSHDPKHNYSWFTSQIDNQWWLDIPFMYLPYWSERMNTAKQKAGI